MGEPRRKYNEQFKREAVELSFHSEKTIKELANDLGISHHNLARWRREYTNKGNLAFPDNGKQKLSKIPVYTGSQQRICCGEDVPDIINWLKRSLSQRKQENNILKQKIAQIYWQSRLWKSSYSQTTL